MFYFAHTPAIWAGLSKNGSSLSYVASAGAAQLPSGGSIVPWLTHAVDRWVLLLLGTQRGLRTAGLSSFSWNAVGLPSSMVAELQGDETQVCGNSRPGFRSPQPQ